MYRGNEVQILIPKMGKAVQVLLTLSIGVFILQLVGERFLNMPVSYLLGFVPKLLLSGWVWQPLTYAFLHAGIIHLVFNLLILWSIGSELEHAWGAKFFLVYFLGCVIGAAITYALFAALGIGGATDIPVVGSSGAVYGMLLAYGILFGDRVLYFFMIFPMRAKYFVMVLGAIVLVSTVFYSENGVAHTAHLGGMVMGLAILVSAAMWKRRLRSQTHGGRHKAQERQRRARSSSAHLRLVKGEEDNGDSSDKPKHWH